MLIFANLVKKTKIIFRHAHPIRFIASRVLRDATILDRFRVIYKYKGVSLRMTRSALALSLWVDPSDREDDWRLLSRVLPEGGVFIDVGAHIGHLSLLAAKAVGLKGRVYAIEAHPRTYGDLIENVKINGVVNILAINVAASDRVSWCRFSDNKNANDQNKVDIDGGLSVLSLPIDLIVDERWVDVLKIDVEGFEKFVLLGARNILERTSVIYFEVYKKHFDAYGYEFSDIYDFLNAYGFSLGVPVSGGLKLIDRSYVPEGCVNVFAWRDHEEFIGKLGLRCV